MVRINGWPLYMFGSAIGLILDRLSNAGTTPTQLHETLLQALPHIQAFVDQPYLPVDTKFLARNLLAQTRPMIDEPDADAASRRANLHYVIIQTSTMLGRDLFWFDLYWIRPKLGLNTTALLTDATVIFPESIRKALPDRVKYEVGQAAACLLYEVPSAVGFHVLRAIELVVLDYFTIPGWSRNDASTWTEYAREFKKRNVHPKIRGMIVRLAELHRNELMHAEAVLSVEEAAILFALMQETLPVMLADVAKRKGMPISDFPILNDPRWQ